MLDRDMLVLGGASTFTIALLLLTLATPTHAAEGALKARNGAKTSISRDVARPVARPPAAKAPGRPVTRPSPMPGRGGNTIINKDNDINVNIQGNNHGGGGHGYPPPPHHGGNDHHDHHDHHDHWDNWNDWDDHPFATAAAITAGVAVTNAIIGSIVYSVPPECVPVSVNGLTYQRCGNTWYQPQYSGTTIQYIVVVAPI